MYKKITSTKLKQKTRLIINQVVETSEPVVIYTYNEPKVILIKYDPKIFHSKKINFDLLKKTMFKIGKRVDTTKLFRDMRDEK